MFGTLLRAACLIGLGLPAAVLPWQAGDPERMASRIVSALEPASGEVVVVRANLANRGALVKAIVRALRDRGAEGRTVTESTPIVQAAGAHADARAFVSLDVNADLGDAEETGLPLWLAANEARLLSLDWVDGTRTIDGLRADYPPALEAMYEDALGAGGRELDARMTRAIERLRSGEVRIRTMHGTSLRFKVGDRALVREDGNASGSRTGRAVVPAERSLHLPAGALRIPPIEAGFVGRLALPRARFRSLSATNVQFFFSRGRALEIQCCTDRTPPLDSAAAAPLGAFASRYFEGVPIGEVAIGFNDALHRVAGGDRVPYRGFGAGMVSLCVGDNEALGGLVRGVNGGPRRCFHLPDATVEAGGTVLVRDGILQ